MLTVYYYLEHTWTSSFIGANHVASFALLLGPSSSLVKVKENLTTSVAYPFTLIKPSWEEGDVTLQDINQRIHAPPKKAPEILGTSAFSGKPVIGKTRIRTEGGKGSITILRTKGWELILIYLPVSPFIRRERGEGSSLVVNCAGTWGCHWFTVQGTEGLEPEDAIDSYLSAILSIAFGTLVNVQASVAFQLLLFSFNFVPWLCLVNYCRCKSKTPSDVQHSYGVFITCGQWYIQKNWSWRN